VCVGEAAAVVQWEPVHFTGGGPVHGAAGQSVRVSSPKDFFLMFWENLFNV